MQNKFIAMAEILKERPALHEFYRTMEEEFMALDPESPEILRPGKLADMNANIPLVNGVRTPGACNVLTTYIPITDETMLGMLRNLTDAVLAEYPHDADVYRVPEEAFHISLVMLHDIRPANMEKDKFKASILGPAQIKEAQEKLASVKVPAFDLTLEGLRFGSFDGSTIAVFTAHGLDIRELRTAIESPIAHLLRPDLIMHEKNMIHISLLRPLQQFDGPTLKRLQRISRTFREVAPVTMHVDRFQLGLETRWQHTEVDVLGTYRLV